MRQPGRGPGNAENGPVVTLMTFQPHESGGIAAFVRNLLAALKAEHGEAFPLVTPATPEGVEDTRYNQMRFAAAALRALSQARPKAVHNHESLPLLCAALLWKLLVLGRVRVIHTVHVDPAERKSWPKRTFIGGLFALCDRVVVVSQDTRRRLSNTALPLRRNVEVIYGAPPLAWQPPAEDIAAFAASFGLGPGPVVCQITRFYYSLKVKGAEQLLAAFQQVRRDVPDAQLLLVGHGPLWQEFRVKHRLETARDGVTLTGFVDDPLLPMALADVYCHISFQDALPIVVLEAMSLGKAVVASAVGGIPEVIEHGVTGMLVNADTEDLSSALTSLLHAPERAATLGRTAKHYINARFSWSKCAAHYAALYDAAPNAKRTANNQASQTKGAGGGDLLGQAVSSVGRVGAGDPVKHRKDTTFNGV